MKAFILAAGFGSRLRPYTLQTPKPLFPIGGKPLIDSIIRQLLMAGFTEIMINTHHLHRQIETYIDRQQFTANVQTCYEPEILGTGGAIRNVADFIGQDPVLIINSDIVSDIDLRAVYDFHQKHDYPVTMVLHDYPAFNQVLVAADEFVEGFLGHKGVAADNSARKLAFTGIQVIDASIIAHIPAQGFYSSIDLYQELIEKGLKVKAFIVCNHTWRDIGTIESYRRAVLEKMYPRLFGCETADFDFSKVTVEKLKGDGSDRRWSRISYLEQSRVMVDHGLRDCVVEVAEVDAFIAIGRHLYEHNVHVPHIELFDAFSGIVCLEDLGDVQLQSYIKGQSESAVLEAYKKVIKNLVVLGTDGFNGFDITYTYQTTDYDRTLILEKECRYFVEAYLNGYLGMDVHLRSLQADFNYLADNLMENAVIGFMHRDMQSRNIMVCGGQYYFIDFQGGRRGPLQYDLASLLFDPYVELAPTLIGELAEYYFNHLTERMAVEKGQFMKGLRYCAIARNLQALGAYGFLSREKGKTYFETYIPPAIRILKRNLAQLEATALPALKTLIEDIFGRIDLDSV